jgi:hypothetical protein
MFAPQQAHEFFGKPTGQPAPLPGVPGLQAAKAIPSYKKGVKYVPKTGVAKLHKGEAILDKKQASTYRAASGMLGAGKSKTKKLVEKAGHELKVNPPKVLKQTEKKKGKAQAEKQRIAIMLSKARAAGADVEEK